MAALTALRARLRASLWLAPGATLPRSATRPWLALATPWLAGATLTAAGTTALAPTSLLRTAITRRAGNIAFKCIGALHAKDCVAAIGVVSVDQQVLLVKAKRTK